MSLLRQASSVQYGATSSVRNTKSGRSSVSADSANAALFRASNPFSTSLAFGRNLGTSKISNVETFIHFIKANIGSGILGIPYAMSLAGIVLGPPLMLFVALLCLYCMILLLRCSRKLSAVSGTTGLGYGDVVELAFQTRFANGKIVGRFLVDMFLVVTQLGFCSIYMILVSNNIKHIVDTYFPQYIFIHLRVYLTVLLVFFMLLSFVWNLKTMAVFSIIGNVFIFIGLGAILYCVFKEAQYDNLSAIYISKVKQLPIFFAMVLYSFEAIGVILPLENQMMTPKKLPLILVYGILLVVLIQVVIGVMGFICFRDEIRGSITYNLPRGVISMIALVSITLCTYFTYSLMLYVPVQILLPFFTRKLINVSSFDIEFWLRTGLVMLTYLFAIAIPHIEMFISLIGAMASTSLALIFPPVSYLLVFNVQRYEKIICVLITVFGVLMSLTGTAYSLMNIIQSLHGNQSLHGD